MTTSPYGFTSWNGQQVLGASPQVTSNMQNGATLYNQATGKNLTAQQYDEMINPTTAAARYGAGASAPQSPYTSGSFDFGNGVVGTTGAGTPMASNFWATPGNQSSATQGLPGAGMSGGGQMGSGAYGGQHGGTPMGGGASTSVMGGGMGASSGGMGMTNPYLPGQATAIGNQQQQLLTNGLNQINSGANAVGGVGGAREGIAQGQAIGMASQGLTDSLANLYGGAYNGDANRYLTQYGMDQSYDTAQRGLDQSQYDLGLKGWSLSNNGAWAPINNASGALAPYAGNGTTTTSGSSGAGWQGLLGGALGGAQLGQNLGWWK